MRTLIDSSGSDRSKRRRALVGRGRPIQSPDCSSEWDSPCRGRALKLVGAGYTFFWSGRKKEERREAGVGFAIKSHLVSKPKCINDRLMTLRLPLSGKRHETIVSDYAPTMTNPDEVKDVLWWSGFCHFCSTPDRQTHLLRGLQCQSGHEPPNLGRSDWIWRCREVQQQWTPPFKEVCRAWITPTQSSVYQFAERHHGCTLAQNTGISLTMS